MRTTRAGQGRAVFVAAILGACVVALAAYALLPGGRPDREASEAALVPIPSCASCDARHRNLPARRKARENAEELRQ